MMRSDIEALQGRWQQVGYERDGVTEPIDEEEGWNPIAEIREHNFSVSIADGHVALEGVFEINEHAQPKTIDWFDKSGPYATEHPILAIYELTETSFVFCAAYDGKARPTEFKTSEGQVLRRMKRL